MEKNIIWTRNLFLMFTYKLNWIDYSIKAIKLLDFQNLSFQSFYYPKSKRWQNICMFKNDEYWSPKPLWIQKESIKTKWKYCRVSSDIVTFISLSMCSHLRSKKLTQITPERKSHMFLYFINDWLPFMLFHQVESDVRSEYIFFLVF